MTDAHKKKAREIVDLIISDELAAYEVVDILAQALADAEPKPSSGWPSIDEFALDSPQDQGIIEIVSAYDYFTKKHISETAKLREALEVAKEALEYYAKPSNWTDGDVPCHRYIPDSDKGSTARDTILSIEEIEK